jgi:predicted amidophosphoribosyltransferase
MLEHYGVTDPAETAAARVEARQCPNCKTVCGPTSDYCSRCGHQLTEEAENEVEQARAEITPEYIRRMIQEGIQEAMNKAGKSID